MRTRNYIFCDKFDETCFDYVWHAYDTHGITGGPLVPSIFFTSQTVILTTDPRLKYFMDNSLKITRYISMKIFLYNLNS